MHTPVKGRLPQRIVQHWPVPGTVKQGPGPGVTQGPACEVLAGGTDQALPSRVLGGRLPGRVGEARGGKIVHHGGVDELPGPPHHCQQRVQVPGAAVGAELGW